MKLVIFSELYRFSAAQNTLNEKQWQQLKTEHNCGYHRHKNTQLNLKTCDISKTDASNVSVTKEMCNLRKPLDVSG